MGRRGIIATVQHQQRREVAMPGSPVRVSTKTEVAPLPGQHSEEMYSDLLGPSAGEIGRLEDDGAI